VHPSSPATALVAYRARLTLTGKKGERELPLEQFFVLPDKDPTRENVLGGDELVVEVRLPATTPATRAAYHKAVEKESFDWPMADVAVVLEMNGRTCKTASIVLGAAAPVPWRAKSSEAILGGRSIDEHAAEAAANAAMQGATPLAKNGYKLPIFRAIVRRTILAAAGGAA
jgi:xanthine dehydrogenase YagS FAD-binding subunit